MNKNDKPRIGIFGRRNVGKSSFVNALIGQEIAIVSEIAGTTTDPVKKIVELPDIGPVVFIDTAGLDDIGTLGDKRVARTLEILNSIDIAILVFENNQFDEVESQTISQIKKLGIPFLIIHNKKDKNPLSLILKKELDLQTGVGIYDFSTLNPQDSGFIVQEIIGLIKFGQNQSKSILEGLVSPGDLILLIAPMDTEAPAGRLILPQVQVLRDALDNGCSAVISKETEVEQLVKTLKPRPVLAITDSQVFKKANEMVPMSIPLTSFSILLAHHKGDFENYLKGTNQLSHLKDGDKILLLESCTHHVTCDDIGRSKLPRWISHFSGKDLSFEVIAGTDKLPENLCGYSMVIQCGACMVTKKQLLQRIKPFVDAGIPVSNYGLSIAMLHGVFDRATAPFIPKKEKHPVSVPLK